MAMFWVMALGMSMLAVGMVVWPLYANRQSKPIATADRETINILLYQDRLAEMEAECDSGALTPEQFEQASMELQRDLLENTVPQQTAQASGSAHRLATSLVVAISLPLLASGIYLWLGTPDAINGKPGSSSVAQHQAAGGMEGMEDAIVRLQGRLAANPDNLDNWLLLGRSLMMQQRYGAAADAYAEAMKHFGENAELIALYAEALTMVQGRVSGRPEELALLALEYNPDTLIALWLAGYAATERDDFATAITHWERLLPLLPAEGRMTRMVTEGLASARQALQDRQ